MVIRRAAMITGLVLLSSAAIAGSWRALMSPGPVSSGHTEFDGQCDSCHLVFKGVPDEKCLKCHAGLARLVDSREGFHATVSKQACITCHTDHKGADFSGTTDAATKAFDHGQTRFPLEAAHAKLECDDCHKQPIDQMEAQCTACHDDPHAGGLGETCQSCHGSQSWAAGLKTLTAHVVPMTGGHQDLKCAQCHDNGAHLEPKVACASCHEQAHGGTSAACDQCHEVADWKPAEFNHDGCTCKFPGKHRTFSCIACHEGFKFTGTPKLCSGCHAEQLTHDPLGECSRCHSALTWKRNKFDHNRKRSPFPLTGEHLAVNCGRCHETKGRRTRFRGAPKACEGCHAEDGETAHGDFGACARCHVTTGFDKPTFDHGSTGFPLTGRHTEVGCQDCHLEKVKDYPKTTSAPSPWRPPLEGPLDGADLPGSGAASSYVTLAAMGFEALAQILASQVSAATTPLHAPSGGKQACAHCHEDPHAGTASTDCAGCHDTAHWRPTTFSIADHAKTKLPLTGQHAEVECRDCHVSAQLTGLPAECAGCHVDRHGGKFGDNCGRCHETGAFSPVTKFDHVKDADFELVGKHAAAQCEACHGGETDLTKRSKPNECATCHALGHGAELGADCERCHAATDASFAAPTAMPAFDHANTGFALERRHAVQRCKSCHALGGVPPQDRCASCHIDPHFGQLTLECAECHRPDRWRLARFDHDQTGWPLRGRHFTTACAQCHTAQRWVGVASECWDCHAVDAGRANANSGVPHPFGRVDCADCHFSGWRWRTN